MGRTLERHRVVVAREVLVETGGGRTKRRDAAISKRENRQTETERGKRRAFVRPADVRAELR